MTAHGRGHRRLRLKYVTRVEAGQSPPSEGVVPWEGEGLPFIQGNAEFGGEHPTPIYRCDHAPRVAQAGDLLVSVRAPVGAVNIATGRIGIGRGLAAVRPTRIHPRYAWWLLHHSAVQLEAVSTGSTFAAVSGSDIGDLTVPIPNPEAQRTVSDYLDRETAQIDAFIAKNEDLIALLSERRAAAYSTLLESSSADRVPVRYLGRIINGGTPPSGDETCWDGDVPFVTPPDLNGLDGAEIRTTRRTLTKHGSQHSGIAPPGSVIVSTRAPIGHIGRTAYGVAFNQGCRAIVPAQHVDTEYLAYAFVAARPTLVAHGQGTTFLELNSASFASIRLPLPPRDEQRRLAIACRRTAAKLDAAIRAASAAIDLARERRSALISAAVTGKIDVGAAA